MTEHKNRALIKISNWMSNIPNIIAANRLKVTAFFLLFTIFMVSGIPRIKLDESMDAWFREDNHALKEYNYFRYVFGSDETLLVMYQPKDSDVFSNESLREVAKIEKILNERRVDPKSELNRITRIRSIVSADYLESRGNDLINRKFVGKRFPKNQAEVEALRKRALEHKTFPGTFFSKDSKFGVLVVRTDYGSRLAKTEKKAAEATNSEDEFDFEGGTETATLLSPDNVPKLQKDEMDAYAGFMDEIHTIFKENGWVLKKDPKDPLKLNNGTETMAHLMTGNPFIMDFFNRVILAEMSVYTGISLLIIMFTLFLALRSFSAVIWPTLIILLAIIWMLGIIGWSGIIMTMMINIVIFLILAAGIASSVHIMSGYKLNVMEDKPSLEALTQTYKNSGLPIFLAAITTAGGMMSLTAVPIVPIRNFAIFAALGVFTTFFGTIFLLPLLMSFWAPKIKNGKKVEVEATRVQRFTKWCGTIGLRKPKTVTLVFTAIMALALTGAPRIVVDSNILEMIKPGYGMKEAYTLLDRHFGGTSSIEIVLDTGKMDGVKDPALLKSMDSLAIRAKREAPDFVARADSLVTVAKDSYRNMTDGTEKNYIIPDNQKVLAQTLITFESADPSTRKLFVDDNWQIARLSLLSFTKGSHEYVEFMADMEKWIDEEFAAVKAANPKLKITMTGGMPMMMVLQEFISKSQVMSFGLALLVISTVLLVMYKSLRFGLMGIVPNLFPIVLVVGALGWAGIALDSDTLLVIPIAIGIAVDDTIHFLTHYRTALLRGYSAIDAIFYTIREVGQAIVFTSFILSTGFLVFTMSAYQAMTNFGLLCSLAISAALIADLIWLPALIKLVRPFENRRSSNENTTGTLPRDPGLDASLS